MRALLVGPQSRAAVGLTICLFLHAWAAWRPCRVELRTNPPAGEGGGEAAAAAEADAELDRAVGQLAELALLGAGRAAELFPSTLDELYEAALDESPFRVVL